MILNAENIVAQGTRQRACFGPDNKKISSLLKKIYNRAKGLYCDAIIYIFVF